MQCACAQRAAHERRMGTAGRDAPRLLSAHRQPADERRSGFPPHPPDSNRAGTGRPGRRTIATRWTQRSSTSKRTFRWSPRIGRRGPPRCSRRSWPAVGRSADRRPAKARSTDRSPSLSIPSAPDSFTTETKYIVARTGETVSRTGKGLVYTGFPVARARHGAGQRQPVARGDVRRARLERDARTLVQRRLRRDRHRREAGAPQRRPGGSRFQLSSALKTGSAAQTVKIYGANLPASPRVEDIGIGQGVKVSRIVERAARRDCGRGRRGGRRADRRERSLGRRRGEVGGARRLRQDRRPQGPPAGRHGPCGRQRVSQAAAAVRSCRRQLRSGWEARHGRRSRSRHRQREVVARGVTPPRSETTTFNMSAWWTNGDSSRRTSMARIRSAPATATTWGDVWVVAELISSDARDMSKPMRARAQLLVTVPLYMAWFEAEGGR